MLNPSPDKNHLSLPIATLSQMPKSELDWHVANVPTLEELQQFLSEKFGSNVKHVKTITTERYHNYVFDLGAKQLVAKIQLSPDKSYLPEGIMEDHLVALDAKLDQVSKILGLIISKNTHAVGLFKEYVVGENLLEEIDNDKISREDLRAELLALADSWATKGYLLLDQKLDNFLRRLDGKLHLIDQGALAHKDKAGSITIDDVRDNVNDVIDLAFNLKANGEKLTELKSAV